VIVIIPLLFIAIIFVFRNQYKRQRQLSIPEQAATEMDAVVSPTPETEDREQFQDTRTKLQEALQSVQVETNPTDPGVSTTEYAMEPTSTPATQE